MIKLNRTLLKATAWIPALAAGWHFLGTWFAPDACLDFGSSFDYVAWHCSHTENHPYINVPAYHFTSFWLFWLGAIFALVVFIWLRPGRHAG